MTATAVLVAALLTASAATAQVYVSDQFRHYIFQFSLGETVGELVNPDMPQPGIEDMELDGEGRLLLARGGNVVLFDPEDQSVSLLDEAGWCSPTYATYPDAASSDIYLVRTVGVEGDTVDCVYGDPELQYLPDGTGPAETAVVFEDSDKLRDVQVWPFGDTAGNILVLSVSPPFMAEVERTGPTTFERLDNVFDSDRMNLRAFSITPGGEILVIDFNDGVFRVEDGELVPYGEPIGPGLQDISVGADGATYVTDSYDNVIHRFDADGNLVLPPMGEGQLVTPRAVVAAGFTPSPPGQNVPTSPTENVDIIFEEIVQGGYTTATAQTSTQFVSPGGNFVPAYVEPPGGRGEFIFFDVDTESIYSRLIQVEIWMEGARMFYAHGTQDTFRDVTIEGPIEDARGTIGRFSEVVLVEDMRPLPTVAEYKFQRLIAKVTAPIPMGTQFCPDGGLSRYRKYATQAKALYDEGRVGEAHRVLERLNLTVRSLAGWCTPDTYPNNLAGEILALSKTLMFSLERIMSPMGRDRPVVAPATLALSATSPMDDRSLIELTGPAGAEVAARVYSASGRLVSTLFEGRLHGGSERIIWDGTDSNGQRVSSGVYFVRLESEGESRSSKVVLIR
jgi:hypothetical protein